MYYMASLLRLAFVLALSSFCCKNLALQVIVSAECPPWRLSSPGPMAVCHLGSSTVDRWWHSERITVFRPSAFRGALLTMHPVLGFVHSTPKNVSHFEPGCAASLPHSYAMFESGFSHYPNSLSLRSVLGLFGQSVPSPFGFYQVQMISPRCNDKVHTMLLEIADFHIS